MDKIWRDIVGFEDSYEISNYGDVRSKERTAPHWRGGTRKIKAQRIAPFKSHNGYQRVALRNTGEKPKKFFVHRLVYITFTGDILEGKEIDHIDGIKSNNTPANLELVTRQENRRRSAAMGLDPKGKDWWTPARGKFYERNSGKGHKRPCAKLTEAQVAEIRWIGINLRVSQQFVADRYRIGISAISRIFNGQNWRHVEPIRPPYSIEKSMRSHARSYSGRSSGIFKGYSK